MRYARVIPSIHTIPGVNEFDYAIPQNANVREGDVIRVPFRKKSVPGIISAISEQSAHADRAILLKKPEVLLRSSPITIALLRATAAHCFSSLPSIFHAWINEVPMRVTPLEHQPSQSQQLAFPQCASHLLANRWLDPEGLIAEARASQGRILILTPWQHRAEHLAGLLHGNALHSALSQGMRWQRIHTFVSSSSNILIATRIGAWLSSCADVALIDEPENDDHKQDELTPRTDARWIVGAAARLRSDLRVLTFGTTPLLGNDEEAPTISVNCAVEAWRRRSGSAIELLSPQTICKIEEALTDDDAHVFLLHPVRGVRRTISCQDCGWYAECFACKWKLSLGDTNAFCTRCGRRASLPSHCPSCSGTNFSRGLPGMEHLREHCRRFFQIDRVHVLDVLEYDRIAQTPQRAPPLIVITDLSLLAGATEDIRKRERLILTWRRIAAIASSLNAALRVQGPEELVSQCRAWLTPDGVRRAWTNELEERKLFGFPPTLRLVKLLIDGNSHIADSLAEELQHVSPLWSVRGPFPVAHRSITRKPRSVLQLITPRETAEEELQTLLTPFALRAHIDLDPSSFFS